MLYFNDIEFSPGADFRYLLPVSSWHVTLSHEVNNDQIQFSEYLAWDPSYYNKKECWNVALGDIWLTVDKFKDYSDIDQESGKRSRYPGIMFLPDEIFHSDSPADSLQRHSLKHLLQTYVYAWFQPKLHLSYKYGDVLVRHGIGLSPFILYFFLIIAIKHLIKHM